MRSWYTTKEVCATLGVGQSRVSQLVSAGELVAFRDSSGTFQYDRESVDAYATQRAVSKAQDSIRKAERKAIQEEARARAKRERERELAREAARVAKNDALLERQTKALEGIAECLSRK